jgi:hypothetical protein
MIIREYYSQIETIINECPIVTHFSIEFDEIDTFVGYLKGTLELIDASVLHFMEFVEIKNDSITLVKYKYQWQFENGDLITRWDNVPHHREIATFPYHMHDNKGVSECPNIDLKAVIEVIMDKTVD